MKTVLKWITSKAIWWFLMALPVIGYAIYILHASEGTGAIMSFYTWITQNFGATFNTGDFATQLIEVPAFKEMLDTLAIGNETFKSALFIGQYMILITFIHLLTDVLLALPRITMKFFEKGGLTDD